MSAQNELYRSGTYHGTAAYVTSGYGNAEQLLQDLRSELLVEKEKKLIAEHRAGDLAKQLKELQELTRVELMREGERRRDAEKRVHDLEQQLRAETDDVRKKADETLSREELILQRGRSALLPVDRTSVGRNYNGLERDENGRQRDAGTEAGHKFGNQGALRRSYSSFSHHTFCNDSNSSYNNNDNDKGDDADDEEWQFIVKHNARILQNSRRKPGKLSRKRFPENHSPPQKSTSVSTYFTHLDGSQGTRPVAAEHMIWRAVGAHERTHSPGQVSSGQVGGSGRIQITQQVSKREGGAENASKGGADDNGVALRGEHTSFRGKTRSNWPASERSEDDLRRSSSMIIIQSPSKERINEPKKLRGKTITETDKEEVPKELLQDTVTTTISHKEATDVIEVPKSSSSSPSIKTDIYADPAFKSRLQRKIFWEQKASNGETELHVQSSGDVRALEESDRPTTTSVPVQRFMKIRAKYELTPSYSEA